MIQKTQQHWHLQSGSYYQLQLGTLKCSELDLQIEYACGLAVPPQLWLLVTALFPAKLRPPNPSLLRAPSNLLPVEGSWHIRENIIVILEMRNYQNISVPFPSFKIYSFAVGGRGEIHGKNSSFLLISPMMFAPLSQALLPCNPSFGFLCISSQLSNKN